MLLLIIQGRPHFIGCATQQAYSHGPGEEIMRFQLDRLERHLVLLFLVQQQNYLDVLMFLVLMTSPSMSSVN